MEVNSYSISQKIVGDNEIKFYSLEFINNMLNSEDNLSTSEKIVERISTIIPETSQVPSFNKKLVGCVPLFMAATLNGKTIPSLILESDENNRVALVAGMYAYATIGIIERTSSTTL